MCLCCMNLKWNTRRRPHQDSRLGQNAILGKSQTKISASSSARFPVFGQNPLRHPQHYFAKFVHRLSHLHRLSRSGHLDTPRSRLGSRFLCLSGEELGGSINVCLAWRTAPTSSRLPPRAERHLPKDSNKVLDAILSKDPESDRALGAILSGEDTPRQASLKMAPVERKCQL